MTVYDNYVKTILRNLDTTPEAWSFKSNGGYRKILEHVTHAQGMLYFQLIKDEFSEIYTANTAALLAMCQRNDKYGKPATEIFADFGLCSPSAMRYVYHGLLILKYMRECKLDNMDIVEIGGGYGGLCFILHQLAKLTGVHIATYTILDLKAPSDLQREYLKALDTPVVTGTMGNVKLEKGSFLISNYGFSEFTADIRKAYTENVLNPYIAYGFLAWNMSATYEFISNSSVEYVACAAELKSRYAYVRPA